MVKTELLAVTLVVPDTAVAVKVADGLFVARVNADLGGVTVRADTIHVVLVAPRKTRTGAKFSFVKINVSADCVK